jgi:phospholipase C
VCYEAFDPNKIPNLAALATEFVIADHTFQSDPAASWGGHLSLVAGAADGFFITYDDCGCFYDHVAPPSPELGIRVPMVVVSPFARRGFTDTNVASYATLLAFTEYVFGLQPLADADANAYAFLNSFDFGQLLLGPVPMVTSPVAADELAYIAAHPPPGDDDT